MPVLRCLNNVTVSYLFLEEVVTKTDINGVLKKLPIIWPILTDTEIQFSHKKLHMKNNVDRHSPRPLLNNGHPSEPLVSHSQE
jgi:hypothetical protein